MTTTIISVETQHDDRLGQPLSGGLVYFFELDTNTPKVTYKDAALTIENTHPVLLNADGALPPVNFEGQAWAQVTDSAGVHVREIPLLGEAEEALAFAAWSATTTYAARAIVQGEDSQYYLSIISGNLGNNPVDTPTAWMRMEINNIYNENAQFSIDDVALFDSRLWISLQDGNTDHQPDISPEWWRPQDSEVWMDPDEKTGNFSAQAGRGYTLDSRLDTFTVTLPNDPIDGAKIYFSDRYAASAERPVRLNRNGNAVEGDNSEDHYIDTNKFAAILKFKTGDGWRWQ